jgi:hypothetical protein
MRRQVISFFAGFLFASLIFGLVVLPYYIHDKLDVSRKQGEIVAELDLINKVIDQLGDDYRRADGYKPLFEVKDTALVVVERNGVKTLRCYNPRPEQNL